eukprot:CAMPEP_0182599292 /NCGR_PEP_ID=MMETSP1324-20130603/90060_1 /TAXON_ID=236786 /ORGANISM="Florenciella sp., Strain RCC1587" /LENGTH=194 /DNA_ID=CAMNT_0024817179 /DNA_START=111 /DNA_END=692 /DNA_ORIENTATION=+
MLKWYKFAGSVEDSCGDQFENLGRFCATKPRSVIGASMLFIFLSFAGFTQINTITDGEKLWIPIPSDALVAKDYVQEKYETTIRASQLILTPSSGSNALNTDVFDSMWSINKAVNQIKFKGQTYRDLCYVPLSATDGNCSYAGVLNYWDNDYTAYVNSVGGSDTQLRTDLSASNYPSGAEALTRQYFADDLTYD